MNATDRAQAAARILCDAWREGRHLDGLPEACRPVDRQQGLAVQAAWAPCLGQAVAGWKIAATSLAGQRHIGVDGPLAGPVFAHRLHGDGACVSLAANRMRVAECEIVFHFGARLAPRDGGYGRDEVLAAVSAVGPGIEVPDSRFLAFERAGQAQLLADAACTNELLLGATTPADARLLTLASLNVHALLGDGHVVHGVGANVLGDPLAALLWFVNERSAAGVTLESGSFVTTGTCVAPIPVQPGDTVVGDWGWLGRASIAFT